MKNGVRLAAALALLVSFAPTAAQAVRVGPRMYSLRMDGYVGAPPRDGRNLADLQIRAAGKTRRFQVTGARVLSGGTSAANVFNTVRPKRPNFILRGPQGTLDRFATAAPGDRFRIIGRWRPGSQDLMVSSIEATGD